eukprot:TRINITY_DN57301_c0_g1_i1.p1 TRINITY_DN57301_c0_g1~~TRINITY_DN57301_c0_g1_i1.p1  ORF type:complete len:456 (+),score=60.79 TRINITY_DN57301_c0_g1_i1:37-1368(+)
MGIGEAVRVIKDVDRKAAALQAEFLEKSKSIPVTRLPPTSLQLWVASSSFDILFGALVICHSILVGIQVELLVSHGIDLGLFYSVGNVLFSLAFVVELLLRIKAGGLMVFLSKNWEWIWFDLLLIIISVAEIVGDVIVAAGQGIDGYSNLRMLRVIKIAKLSRSIKLARIFRFVRSFGSLLVSILAAMRSLVWSFALLLLVMYSFALVFVQASYDHVSENGSSSAWTGLRYWRNLSVSLLTLFQSVCGGIGWDDAMIPLREAHWGYQYFLCAYILFSVFCVLNGVTGAFCNSAIESAMANPDVVAENIIRRNNAYANRMRHLFEMFDTNDSGTLTVTEFEDVLKNVHMSAVLMAMDIDASDAWALFQMLDINDDKSINSDEFIVGCLRLRGPAKALDIMHLDRKVDRLMEALDNISVHSTKQNTHLTRILNQTASSLESYRKK